MGDFEDELAKADTVTSLHFNFKSDGVFDGRIAAFVNLEELQLRECPPDLVLPEELLGLPKLRHLGLTGKDDKLVVPELVRRLHIEHLDVWDLYAGDLPPLPALRALEIVVKDPKSEVAILAERFNQLRHLEVWGSHLEHGELPDDIERFSYLEKLFLVSCGVKELPAGITKLDTLRTFGVRGCPMTQFPEALTRMPRLAEVQIGVCINGLPPAIANMTGLRDLDLSGALNKGAMISSFDDTDKLKALPRVLGELVNLEKLDLDHCGVFDVDPLRTLANLQKLSLSWAGIETVEPLGELSNLEELSIEHCDRVKDLSPLGRLKKLRVLNLDNTESKSLDVLRELPALKELHIEGIEAKRIDAVFDIDVELHADDEIKERYEARASLRKLPTIGDIVKRLGMRDYPTVEVALEQLVLWVGASSTRRHNSIATALGLPAAKRQVEDDDSDDDDDDDEDEDVDEDDFDDDDDDDDDDADADDEGSVRARGQLPVLDTVLDRFLARLPADLIARTFGVLFQDVNNDFPAAIRIANELVSRGDDAAQLIMIDGFAKANEYYDTGHREHSNNVHDTLIDRVFPILGGPALAKLLDWCSDGHLDEDQGDAMLGMFVPALERAGDAERDVVIARLEKYVTSRIQYSDGAATAQAVWQMLDGLPPGPTRDGIAAMRSRLSEKLAASERRAALEKRLESEQPGTVAGGVAELAEMSVDAVKDMRGAMWRANECENLDRDTRRALLVIWKRIDQEGGITDCIENFSKYVAIDELREDLHVLGVEREQRGKYLREAILDGFHKIPADRLEALRGLATEHDNMPRAEADSAEVRALLFRSAKRYERDGFVHGITALASLAEYLPKQRSPSTGDDDDDDDDGDESELASMVAHLAECSDFDELGVFARNLHKLGVSGKPLQRILAQLVAVCMVNDDPEGLEAVMPLVPPSEQVTWDILAFNLACKSARDASREETFRFTKRALELGKSPDQFLSDTDFAAFHEDTEFVALLDSFR